MASQLRATVEKRDVHAFVYPWTAGDDDQKDYDVTIMRKRNLRRKVLRRGTETNFNTLKKPLPQILRIPAGGIERRTAVDVNVDSESDSESDDDDSQDEEEETSSDTKDSQGDVELDRLAPVLAAPSTNGTVEGSGESMVVGVGNMHSDIHNVIIAVGVLGGVILLAGIGFFAWRLRKRVRGAKPPPADDMAFEKPSRFEKIISKVPFLRSRFGHHGWYTIEEPVQTEKRQLSPEPIIRPDEQYLTPGKPANIHRIASTRSYGPEAISPISATFVESTAVQVQVIARHDPQEMSRPQHKRMPSTSPQVYDVNKRQTGYSSLSSLSSGFGDGDIVITPTDPVFPLHPAPVAGRHVRRDTSSSAAAQHTRRDTTSTVATVDPRPRFHTVNSWVKQQKGELHQAQKNVGDGETPPVPVLAPPPEQEWRYMMPDTQTPRRVEF